MTSERKAEKFLVAVFVYNEDERLRETLARFPADRAYDVMVMDDGSDNDITSLVQDFSFPLLRHESNLGIGAGVRTVAAYAEENGYDAIVMMAGNGKMHPSDIPGLLKPIIHDQCDYVQGSRYLKGAQSQNLPLFRRVMIPLFTGIVRLVYGHALTDVTCGLRAFHLNILRHPEVDISQSWLSNYEMEYYILCRAMQLGFSIAEAPASMTYPKATTNYSKITPLIGWWQMIRPWIFLTLRLKK